MDAYTESIQKSPLLGEETVTVDGKFRVLFSKKKRDRLGENFVLAIGLKGCLEALPRATFDQMTAEILAAPPLNMGRQEYASMLARNSDDDQNFDSEGRVLIPVGLRAKGKIAQKGKLVLEGAIDRVRIWSEADWEAYNQDPEGYGSERSNQMLRLYKMMKEGA